MLVTRQPDPIRKTWTSSKLGAHYQNPATPRMSNFDESISTQPDWREQYSSYLNSSELPAAPYDSSAVSPGSLSPTQTGERPSLQHRHTTANYGVSAETEPQVVERPSSAPGEGLQGEVDQQKTVETVQKVEPLENVASSNAHITASATEELAKKEARDSDLDDDDADLDDDMLDVEDGAGASGKTAAERRAERRKMKRFRLTHQQTRFLMSEFAKQAHPDAAHRERLSREIPGLSPRQVQVWFQNRRAKIKRLNADDRERMMKMRAVPDDFDNVQALHSPYGAVHPMTTPLQSPMGYVPPYGQRSMQPLMVDTMDQRAEEEHISPSGMSPAFHHVGFPHSGMASPDILSPLSINSGDRYYGSLNSPLSAGPHSANSFRTNNGENYPPAQRPPQGRPLQPLQLREAMSRSRSESVASPLRSSMSWKGDSLDYGNYSGIPSPVVSSRQQSMYQPEQAGSNAVGGQQFDNNAYSNPDVHASPTQMSYPAAHQAGPLSSSPVRLNRLRTSSAAFPPGLDLRAQQCRPMPANMPGSARGIPPTPRSGSFSGSFSAGFQSAPLTAPVDFQIPRVPDAHRDYNMPQMSAPMAPPSDFTYAQSTLSPERTPQQATFQQSAMGEHHMQESHNSHSQVSQAQ